jgi:hypothetical protein
MNPLNALIWLALLSPVDNRPGIGDLDRFPDFRAMLGRL